MRHPKSCRWILCHEAHHYHPCPLPPASKVILGISPDSQGELTGNHVKFATGSHPMSPVYSVVWPKVSEPRRLIVGLTLPEDGQAISEKLSEWVKRAYEQTLSSEE
jgi:hypothetical protein